MSFPRYPEYKNSGVYWLGEVPAHWQTMRLRYISECLDGRRIPLNAAERADRQGDIPYWGANSIVGYVDEALFDEDLILLGEDGAPFFDRTKPVAFFSEGKVWPNNHVHVLRPKIPGSGRYVVYALNVTDFAQFIDGSTRDKLTQSAMNNIPLPWPSLSEQTAIAAFLDLETAKIDALVAEQQRLIELLKEKRQAVISHAVTKGLNPDASMKPSGVEWLGEVPAHWEVVPVASRYHVQLGKMLDSNKISGQHLRPYLRVFDVQWGRINTEDLPHMDFDEDDRAKFLLSPGDLLVNEGGSYPGRSAIWQGTVKECYYQKALHRLRPHSAEKDTAKFMYYVMAWAAAQGVFVAGGNETTIEHLPAEKLRRYRFGFPPLEEQNMIAIILDREIGKLDALTSEAQRAIDLLQERRTALISAAVTGQIDVRGIADRVAA